MDTVVVGFGWQAAPMVRWWTLGHAQNKAVIGIMELMRPSPSFLYTAFHPKKHAPGSLSEATINDARAAGLESFISLAGNIVTARALAYPLERHPVLWAG